MGNQLELPGAAAEPLHGTPPGFAYRPAFLDEREERALLEELARLPFDEVRMRGVVARRRVAHFGFTYAYDSAALAPGPGIPAFLLPLRDRCAALAGEEPARLEEALVTWYPPGAGIGWHRDAAGFGTVVGVSLLSPCRMRFRRGSAGRAAFELVLEPRSAYVLRGSVRWAWQHAIPAGTATRYSITFRTVGVEARGSRSR